MNFSEATKSRQGIRVSVSGHDLILEWNICAVCHLHKFCIIWPCKSRYHTFASQKKLLWQTCSSPIRLFSVFEKLLVCVQFSSVKLEYGLIIECKFIYATILHIEKIWLESKHVLFLWKLRTIEPDSFSYIMQKFGMNIISCECIWLMIYETRSHFIKVTMYLTLSSPRVEARST